MKVSYRQLQAIVKLMATASLVDQTENQESEKMLRFLQEFKLSDLWYLFFQELTHILRIFSPFVDECLHVRR